MAASNMATIKQEFDSSGIPSMKPYLDYLLENGAAKPVTIRWGQSYRKVIFIGGKRYQYKGGHNINKNLKIKIASLYISMSSKPSKQNTNTIKDDAVRNTLSNAYKTSNAIVKIKNIYDGIRKRRVKKVLSSHSLKYKPDVIETTSALNKYTNSLVIKGSKLKGLSGLSYIKYQHLLVT